MVPVEPAIDLVAEQEEEIIDRPLTPEEERRLGIRRQIERMAVEDPEQLSRLIRAWMAED